MAQIWCSDPEKFFEAGRRIAGQFEFDGIDINMGCPGGVRFAGQCQNPDRV